MRKSHILIFFFIGLLISFKASAEEIKAMDHLSSANGWNLYVSDNSKGELKEVNGFKNKGIALYYDINANGGWVSIEKPLKIGIKEESRFSFYVKRKGREPMTIEFKLIDKDGSVFGKKYYNLSSIDSWKKFSIEFSDLSYLWGGDSQFNEVNSISFAISGERGEKGKLYLSSLMVKNTDGLSLKKVSTKLKIKRAWASSSLGDNAASAAFDGDFQTRWESHHKVDPSWLACELESRENINKIEIIWERAAAAVYKIQISDDALNWKTVFNEKNSSGKKDLIILGKQKARYIRLLGIQRATEWGYSIYEFKIDYIDDAKIPQAPSHLSIKAVDNVNFVNWDDNSETDLYGYNIYGSTKLKGKYKKINKRIIQASKYKDIKIKKGIKYYYVKAVDYSKNKSKRSKIVLAKVSKRKKRKFFPVPACAWKRYLGDIPDECESSSPNRGVALGGFGTGSFMYNISGSFGPFQALDNVIYKRKWFSEAAFHIYEKQGSKKIVKCLATDPKIKKAWDKIKTGDAHYYALQPKGWVNYSCFKADISQKFFSPIIPHNYKETSYPVAIWQFQLYNPTGKNMEISVMLTFPDIFIGEKFYEEEFKNYFVKDKDIKGVVLKSKKGIGQWCIAARELKGVKVSYLTGWNASGNGKDVWNDFKDDGLLKNTKLDDSHSAVAIAVKVKLKAKEKKIIPFVITWDFPVVKFGKGTEWWKKYTQYFGRKGDNSFRIAKESLRNYKKWEKEIDKWMDPVINNKKYPDWLKQAAFNELYYTQFGGSFYEAGLKSGHDREYRGLHEEDNKFFVMECMLYPFANTYDVRHYSSLIFARFWPEIEKEIQMSFADAIMHFDPEHQTPHDAGNPHDDPFFGWDNYGTRKLHWKDLHSKFIQQVWRYYYLYRDKDFLNYVWEACKSTYEYMKTTDLNQDGLPDNKGSDNTYDAWGLWGTSLLCGGLWVGALESMEQMAKIMKDPISDEVKKILKKAKFQLNKQLWYEKGRYYKIDTGSKFPTAIMADGLNGQRYCEFYGLADILPKKRIKSHLMQVYKRNVVPLKDFNKDGIGDCGAINGMKEGGGFLEHQGKEIWTGSTYFLAASMYHAGLKKEALKTAYGVYYLTYKEESTAYWFNTPEAWQNGGKSPRPSNPEQYQRPRAVWELLLEMDDPYKKRR